MTIPVSSPIVVKVTPPATPAVTINEIKVGGINTPSVAYHHTQSTSASTWTIIHNLGWYPNVTTMDSSGSICEGEIVHTSNKRLTVTFLAAFSGNAYLS
jgi:hypothetical protein